MAEVLSTFQIRIGDQVPNFSLPGFQGEMHAFDDLMGSKGLLVVFACNHCPFVVHLADALGQMAREIKLNGIQTVAINSNDILNYPQDGPSGMAQFVETHQWEFPYLLDESQQVAMAYRAACTPDFFLTDPDGRLFYAGQFDDTRPRSGNPPHGGDLREAIRRMLCGESPLERPYPSSGCNIKWKDGNQPAWWNTGA